MRAYIFSENMLGNEPRNMMSSKSGSLFSSVHANKVLNCTLFQVRRGSEFKFDVAVLRDDEEMAMKINREKHFHSFSSWHSSNKRDAKYFSKSTNSDDH